MKKSISLILVLVLTLCLCACGETVPKHTMTFAEGREVTVDMNGEPLSLVGVFTDYTNFSGETCLPCDAIPVYAYQNGIELSSLVFVGQTMEGAIQCDTRVQTDTTARVVWLYQPQDRSEVSLEFGDGQRFTFTLD